MNPSLLLSPCHTFVICIILHAAVISVGKQCIKSKVGSPCSQNEDCFELEEHHLYCNKTGGANICSFHQETYIGQVEMDKDCPGVEYSAESWSNPVDLHHVHEEGIDCMRMCLFTETCFGITIHDHHCFLKNEKCFGNLVSTPGAIVGVLNVVREDYHCGCHYPFTRRRSSGELLEWDSECPASRLSSNPYRCCSEKGLCVKCST